MTSQLNTKVEKNEVGLRVAKQIWLNSVQSKNYHHVFVVSNGPLPCPRLGFVRWQELFQMFKIYPKNENV